MLKKIVCAVGLLLSSFSMAQDCVILLHGLLRSADAMEVLSESLAKHGYKVVNNGYPSREHPIEILAKPAVENGLKSCGVVERVHFVTHSLGGILVRYYLAENTIENLGRVVMLGPPNQGSGVVDFFRLVPGYTFMNGPTGLQLGKDEKSVPLALGPVEFETGIIAGTRSWNLILSQFLENPDDGKVSVQDTKVAGMNDHLELPVTHTFMMSDATVIEQVLYFLKNGVFFRN